jgi:hypothetical protein
VAIRPVATYYDHGTEADNGCREYGKWCSRNQSQDGGHSIGDGYAVSIPTGTGTGGGGAADCQPRARVAGAGEGAVLLVWRDAGYPGRRLETVRPGTMAASRGAKPAGGRGAVRAGWDMTDREVGTARFREGEGEGRFFFAIALL